MICSFIPVLLLPLGFLKVWRLQLEAQGPSTFLLDGRDRESESGPKSPQGFSPERAPGCWVQKASFLQKKVAPPHSTSSTPTSG